MIRHEAVGASIMGALYLAVFFLAEIWARQGGSKSPSQYLLSRRNFGFPAEPRRDERAYRTEACKRGATTAQAESRNCSPEWGIGIGSKPEWPRKAVHVGGGILSLVLPHFVYSPWTVLGMAVFFAGFCFLGRRTGLLRCLALGAARPTWGSELYPFSVFIVFVMAGGRHWLYVGSILTLALADAGAALIGMAYGKTRYRIEREHRSLEGSLMFMALAFLSIFLSMWQLGEFGWAQSALTAGLASFLATGIEAVSLRGSDNLLVPVGVCLALPWLLTLWPG